VVEARIRIQVVVQQPAVVAEPVYPCHRLPLARLRIVDLCRQSLIHITASSPHDQQLALVEDAAVLEPRLWLPTPLYRRLYPVPPTISMLSQPPDVFQTPVVSRPPPEYHHHASSRALSTNFSRVIDPWNRFHLPNRHFTPLKGGLLDVKDPDVVVSLLTVISSTDDEQGLVEDHRVAVAAAGGHAEDWHAHPLAFLALSEVEQVQLVARQLTAATCSSVNHQLVRVDASRSVLSPLRRL